jgi:predicted glycoside hydrolase/deacetylase ChbG (UPF0249 family)
MSFKRLIVNADDLGADNARNRGIFEAAERGCVTDATLLVNLPGFEDAIQGLRTSRLQVGLHFNISEGVPVGGPYRTLVDANGRFHGKDEAWRLGLAGVLDPAEVRAEAEAQLARCRSADVAISHLDGHQHIHMIPCVAAGLIALPMPRKVRLSLEEPNGTVLSGPDKVAPLRKFREATRASQPLWEAAGWRWPQALLGSGLIGAVHVGTIVRLLDQVRSGGTSELLVHPGYPEPSAELPFSSAEREIELEALLDPRLREAIVLRGIVLSSWSEF